MEPSKFSCSLCKISFKKDLIPFILPSCTHFFCYSCIQRQSNSAHNNDGNFICSLDDKSCKNPLSELKIAPFYNDLSHNNHQLKGICEKHPNKEIEFKCLEDLVFLCSLCLLEHDGFHQKEKLNLTLDMKIVEEKLVQMKIKTDSYLEKAEAIKASNIAKSNEILEFFKNSTNLLNSPFCPHFNDGNDPKVVFPLNFSVFKINKLAKISAVAARFEDPEIEFVENIFLPRKIRKLNLLFRASQKQFSAKEFHKHCDTKGPTLTLIKSKTGRAFGAFSTTSWMNDKNGKYYSAPGSFLFSVQGQKKFDLLNQYDSGAIFCFFEYGPTFGSGYDLFLSDCCDKNEESYSNLGSSFKVDNKMFESRSSEARSFFANSYYFTVDEYEVFSIEFAK